MLEFNINYLIAVRLTDAGRAEHKRQYEELSSINPNMGEYVPPVEDIEGWSVWKGWVLFKTFGHMCSSTHQPFEATIRVGVAPPNPPKRVD
ncbi:hypothetical protein [Neptuniibacter sp. QD37_11]|uniref:hypothetical protein n=1 Tax=Neptuniibacter sp. QD37_11 TaxID=3398209 RepID=UPI0039F4D834